MPSTQRLRRRQLVCTAILLLAACAMPEPRARYLAEDFSRLEITRIALLPVTYRVIVDTTHGRSPGENLGPVLLERLAAKGYRVEPLAGVETGGLPNAAPVDAGTFQKLASLAPPGADAVLYVDIDHYFVDLANPLLSSDNSIDLHAGAWLIRRSDARLLWEGAGWARFGGARAATGAGATGQLSLPFRVLTDNLLRTLPDAP